MTMKRFLLFATIFLAAVVAALSQTGTTPSFQPKEGFVPNSETAIKIAEAVLIPVYGEKQIVAERPFKAVREGDVWTVTGTLHCAPHCLGGVAEVKISKTSGQILQVIHGK